MGLGWRPGRTRRSWWWDLLISVVGFLLALTSLFFGILGPLIMLVVYLATRESSPALARGIGSCLIAMVVVCLGALALCIALLSSGAFQ